MSFFACFLVVMTDPDSLKDVSWLLIFLAVAFGAKNSLLKANIMAPRPHFQTCEALIELGEKGWLAEQGLQSKAMRARKSGYGNYDGCHDQGIEDMGSAASSIDVVEKETKPKTTDVVEEGAKPKTTDVVEKEKKPKTIDVVEEEKKPKVWVSQEELDEFDAAEFDNDFQQPKAPWQMRAARRGTSVPAQRTGIVVERPVRRGTSVAAERTSIVVERSVRRFAPRERKCGVTTAKFDFA